MKKKTFIRLSLLFPYFLWIVFAGFTVLMSEFLPAYESQPAVSGILSITFVYVFGILVWGAPYTILSLGLWVWSRGKSTNAMTEIFAFAPLFMAFLVSVEVLILQGVDDGVSLDFWQTIFGLGGLSLAFGYGIIGIIAGVYKFLQTGNFIQLEVEIPPQQTTSINQ